MSETVVYECPECGDRKLLYHNQQSLYPQIWCGCDGFTTMEIDRSTLVGETDD